MSDLKAELEILHEDMRRCAGATAAALKDNVAETSQAAMAEFERLIAEIKNHIADAESEVEGLVTEHPLAALASAFVAGVAVGRMMARAR